MSMFFDLLSSINDPNKQGSVAQLETLTAGIQQAAADRGIDSSQLGTILSSTGNLLAPALQQQSLQGSGNQLGGLIGQLAGGGAGSAVALQSLIPPQLQQQIVEGIAQTTGVSPNAIQGLLPTLLTTVAGLLNFGADKSGTDGSNHLLNAFLSGGNNADLGRVMQFADRFLNPA